MSNTSVLSILKGQPRVVEFLERACINPQGGYVFFGPDGVGKRTAAILFAAAVNPPSFTQDIQFLAHPDIITLFPFKASPQSGKDKWSEELNEETRKYMLDERSPEISPSWVISIDRIREVRREMKYPPRILKCRVVLLFDFDRIRDEGANAFLKTLEEPEENTILILTTSRPFAIPATVRSRCKLVRFSSLDDEVIRNKLLADGFEESDVETAVDMAFGSLRLAYDYLENKEDFISEKVLNFLHKPGGSKLELIDLIDGLGYRTPLDKVMDSFGLVFRWVLRSRSGKIPKWNRLARIVSELSSSMSRESLVHNVHLTEKMAGQVILNPTPSLFLYRYLSSLRFN